jgi:hypothetical protein
MLEPFSGYHLRRFGASERRRTGTRNRMNHKPLLLGALSIGAVAALAGCGGSSSPTPTPTTGLSLPNIPGLPTLGSGSTGTSGGSAPAAGTLLTVSTVQTISGDPNVTALSCTADTCVYADASTSATGGGGVIVVEPFPGGFNSSIVQAAISAALAGQSSASGGTTVAVTGLGSGGLKEIDATSATYAFAKDNYLVVINVTSGTNSGASMDSQVQAAAQQIAGQI